MNKWQFLDNTFIEGDVKFDIVFPRCAKSFLNILQYIEGV